MNCEVCGHNMDSHRIRDGECVMCAIQHGPCFPWEFR